LAFGVWRKTTQDKDFIRALSKLNISFDKVLIFSLSSSFTYFLLYATSSKVNVSEREPFAIKRNCVNYFLLCL